MYLPDLLPVIALAIVGLAVIILGVISLIGTLAWWALS